MLWRFLLALLFLTPAAAFAGTAQGLPLTSTMTRTSVGSYPIMMNVVDTNRSRVIISTTNMASVNGALISTFSYNLAGAITNGATVYIVRPGKTLRIQSFSYSAVPASPYPATPVLSSTTLTMVEGTQCNSPRTFDTTLLVGTTAQAQLAERSIPDGLEFPSNTQLSFCHRSGVATIREEFSLIGFEY